MFPGLVNVYESVGKSTLGHYYALPEPETLNKRQVLYTPDSTEQWRSEWNINRKARFSNKVAYWDCDVRKPSYLPTLLRGFLQVTSTTLTQYIWARRIGASSICYTKP